MGQVARWSIAASQVLGWQPFLWQPRCRMVWSQTVRFLWRALRMKYMMWPNSPGGFLNNRCWINGIMLRRVGWKAWPLTWHHVPCNRLFYPRTKDLGDELKCEVRGWNHKAGLLRASMLIEYKARDYSCTLHWSHVSHIFRAMLLFKLWAN